MWVVRWGACLWMGLMAAGRCLADNADLRFFEAEVRPLLAGHCHQCHGPLRQEGGLRLDVRANVLAGGESGPALVEGQPDRSLLIEAVEHRSLVMPPEGKLSDQQVAVLREWIARGALWPGPDQPALAVRRPGQLSDDDRQWWAFQPMRLAPVPEVPGGATSVIDAWIRTQLVQAGLAPAPLADRNTLLRRLSFDVTGLPPTAAETAAFLADDSPQAIEHLIDRLLASPHYGERWARPWLDLVRYADSDGYRIDDYRRNAWRYRDYVVRALNRDKPYDRFVQEQLAGDELFPDDPEALIATGYLRHGIYEYNNRDVHGQWQTILDDVTDTTADVFLGLGLQCAKCHDHKYDPLLHVDYYRFQAFFAGMLPRDDLTATTPAERASYQRGLADWLAATDEQRMAISAIEANPRDNARKGAIGKFPADVQELLHRPVDQRTPREHQVAELAWRQVQYEYDRVEGKLKGSDKDRYLALKKQLAEADRLKPPELPVVQAVTDVGPQAGEVLHPRRRDERLAPGYPTVFDPLPAAIATDPRWTGRSTGRRATLAQWLTQPNHPLTARVIVNRVWQQHFGRGLAANASDFGRLGEPPTHPELLDWLALKFVEHGWSLKWLHREILLSHTYQQSAQHPDAETGHRIDPENRLYWRGQVRRLDAEQLRDAAYAVTGELKSEVTGGPGLANDQPRRSIYLRMMRNSRLPLFDVFDVPAGLQSAASRHVTTTPVQSLLLLNGPFLLKRAAALQQRLFSETDANAAARVTWLYQQLVGRTPTENELAAACEFIEQQSAVIHPRTSNSPAAQFVYEKLPFRDGQAAVVSEQQPALRVPAPLTPTGDFTIEAFVLLRSVYESSAVRVIAASWDGDRTHAGWSLGVTGKQSRRKPQTLVLQLAGHDRAGQMLDEAIFADHHLELHKPYYVAAAVRFGQADGAAPSVEFFVKDLANDDEPLLTAHAVHRVATPPEVRFPFTMGGRAHGNEHRFDGLIDDVRLSATALDTAQLLLTADGSRTQTLGYWRFEAQPDVFADSSGRGQHVAPPASADDAAANVPAQAWIDLCHVLLNSNEFLYVQ